MTFGSLFSGIGGLDLGLERAGWSCRWQVEIDPFCTEVLKKHWPEVPKHGDIRSLDSGILEPVGLICGGFPCQPVSVAGRRKGTEDTRWLWPEFSRIVRDLRPRFVLIENVPGLRTANGGEAFAEVLGDLARHGYDAEWASLPAAAVGAPHLRYRVFLVAYAKGFTGQIREAESERPWRFAGSGHNVADATIFSQREPLNEAYTESTGRQTRAVLGGGSWWSTQCRLGVHSDGPSGGLDCGGWECGIPRVAKGQAHRVDRLRALGNAVVPQCAEYVGRLLALNLSEIERGVR